MSISCAKANKILGLFQRRYPLSHSIQEVTDGIYRSIFIKIGFGPEVRMGWDDRVSHTLLILNGIEFARRAPSMTLLLAELGTTYQSLMSICLYLVKIDYEIWGPY